MAEAGKSVATYFCQGRALSRFLNFVGCRVGMLILLVKYIGVLSCLRVHYLNLTVGQVSALHPNAHLLVFIQER